MYWAPALVACCKQDNNVRCQRPGPAGWCAGRPADDLTAAAQALAAHRCPPFAARAVPAASGPRCPAGVLDPLDTSFGRAGSCATRQSLPSHGVDRFPFPGTTRRSQGEGAPQSVADGSGGAKGRGGSGG